MQALRKYFVQTTRGGLNWLTQACTPQYILTYAASYCHILTYTTAKCLLGYINSVCRPTCLVQHSMYLHILFHTHLFHGKFHAYLHPGIGRYIDRHTDLYCDIGVVRILMILAYAVHGHAVCAMLRYSLKSL
jgi:hypothetical protein